MPHTKHEKRRLARQAHAAVSKKAPGNFPQEQKRGGLLVTDELEKALQECKAQVAEIAADCRRKNRKFRDVEFDIELDKDRCLHGLRQPGETGYAPADVRRATQIFDKASFFIDGADSNDLVQGQLGDCWFLSALATMSTAKGLVEKFCVARDEQVGVYGFIFFRDTTWVTVIVDDLLYTSIPKFEELKYEERQLYHHDKDSYNTSARKSGKSLLFARSGTDGETWVPLIEKAFAKLHGNYAALSGGEAGEAIEDLTGGVTSFIYTKDILDTDAFWTNELLHANIDRLFGCAFDNLDSTRSGVAQPTVNGLMGGHAYSVLRAVEYKGKRFVVIRNPWGQCEWTGPWSDGSKEWTSEWLAALPLLEHSFGDDGEFVMEYKDFLENWAQIDRTLLFDSSWIMSSQWLKVAARPQPAPWAFGDVSFTISLAEPSSAVIVLSKLDDRYWGPISGSARWSFDFIIFKKGESKPITTSSASLLYSRSVNAEISLEAGDYVIHVRLDRFEHRDEDYLEAAKDDWSDRIYARVLTEKIKSQSIASNFDPGEDADYLPVSLGLIAGQDLSELETKATEVLKAKELEAQALAAAKAATAKVDPSAATKATEALKGKELEAQDLAAANAATAKVDPSAATETETEAPAKTESAVDDQAQDAKSKGDAINEEGEGEGGGGGEEKDKGADEQDEDEDESEAAEKVPHPPANPSDENTVYLGLRVYTKKSAPAKVDGQLRHTSLAVLAGGLSKSSQSVEPVPV
ncbi:hypothetical protein DXG01_005432 [Tephrocybe rancida]|nr:hypothetical protein DXG01_005432 [Tephrocybe rancida]